MCWNSHSTECVSETENVLHLEGGRKEYQKSEGCKNELCQETKTHEQYKEVLFEAKQLRHGMNIL